MLAYYWCAVLIISETKCVMAYIICGKEFTSRAFIIALFALTVSHLCYNHRGVVGYFSQLPWFLLTCPYPQTRDFRPRLSPHGPASAGWTPCVL